MRGVVPDAKKDTERCCQARDDEDDDDDDDEDDDDDDEDEDDGAMMPMPMPMPVPVTGGGRRADRRAMFARAFMTSRYFFRSALNSSVGRSEERSTI
jgi:hypothetical protein